MEDKKLDFFKNRIRHILEEYKDELGDLRYRLYMEMVNQSNNYEEIKEMADLEMQVDLLEYTKNNIKNPLKKMNVEIKDIKREFNPNYDKYLEEDLMQNDIEDSIDSKETMALLAFRLSRRVDENIEDNADRIIYDEDNDEEDYFSDDNNSDSLDEDEDFDNTEEDEEDYFEDNPEEETEDSTNSDEYFIEDDTDEDDTDEDNTDEDNTDEDDTNEDDYFVEGEDDEEEEEEDINNSENDDNDYFIEDDGEDIDDFEEDDINEGDASEGGVDDDEYFEDDTDENEDDKDDCYIGDDTEDDSYFINDETDEEDEKAVNFAGRGYGGGINKINRDAGGMSGERDKTVENINITAESVFIHDRNDEKNKKTQEMFNTINRVGEKLSRGTSKAIKSIFNSDMMKMEQE